jgi:hypothetical protein
METVINEYILKNNNDSLGSSIFQRVSDEFPNVFFVGCRSSVLDVECIVGC